MAARTWPSGRGGRLELGARDVGAGAERPADHRTPQPRELRGGPDRRRLRPPLALEQVRLDVRGLGDQAALRVLTERGVGRVAPGQGDLHRRPLGARRGDRRRLLRPDERQLGAELRGHVEVLPPARGGGLDEGVVAETVTQVVGGGVVAELHHRRDHGRQRHRALRIGREAGGGVARDPEGVERLHVGPGVGRQVPGLPVGEPDRLVGVQAAVGDGPAVGRDVHDLHRRRQRHRPLGGVRDDRAAPVVHDGGHVVGRRREQTEPAVGAGRAGGGCRAAVRGTRRVGRDRRRRHLRRCPAGLRRRRARRRQEQRDGERAHGDYGFP